jgi:BMFP domain-containing protein YqiC
MQTRNPLFDDLARLATGAAGVAQGFGEEARSFWRAQMERAIADMDLVRRDEHEALKDVAAAALARVEALEARLAVLETASAKAAPKTKAKAKTA